MVRAVFGNNDDDDDEEDDDFVFSFLFRIIGDRDDRRPLSTQQCGIVSYTRRTMRRSSSSPPPSSSSCNDDDGPLWTGRPTVERSLLLLDHSAY